MCGFIPLNNLRYEWGKGLPPTVCSKEICQDPVSLHYQVAEKKMPNFLGARIQVNFNFNHDLYDTLLQGYWDWQIPMLLRYGFPINFLGNEECIWSENNREQYLDEKCKMGGHIWPCI